MKTHNVWSGGYLEIATHQHGSNKDLVQLSRCGIIKPQVNEIIVGINSFSWVEFMES